MKTSEFVVGRRNQSSCTPHFLHGFRRWLPGATALLVLSLCAGTPCFAEEIKAEAVERQVNLTPAQRLQTGVAGFRERVDSRGRIVRRMFIGPVYCKGRFEQGGRNCLHSRVDIAREGKCKP